MYFVDSSGDGSIPNITKTEKKEANQKGKEGKGMHTL